MKWAVLDDDRRVVQILESAEMPSNSVKVPSGVVCSVGYTWNGWSFDSPRWTAYEFMLRFTFSERAAIRSAAASDPLIDDFLFLATAAREIASDDPTTIAGMDALVSAGIISSTRKQEILS